jgi:hypothetical protein
MNEKPASHSRTANWALGLIAALLLYGLSIGAVAAWTVYTHGENIPRGRFLIYAPIVWCSARILILDGLIQSYNGWWIGLGYKLRSKAGYH